MPDQSRRPRGPQPAVQEFEDTRQLWRAVFAASGPLSGFCLEWLLDRAEFSNGCPS
ncbi:hypothetical protein [Cribrihabitans pelagius]|uniref:hypothetical protein n=1 Tax=Cribrihabitans pelagius TaxID=1765746 RepID=UPI003B5AA7E8